MNCDPLPDFEPLNYFIKSMKHKIPISKKSVCDCQMEKWKTGMISLLIYTFGALALHQCVLDLARAAATSSLLSQDFN